MKKIEIISSIIIIIQLVAIPMVVFSEDSIEGMPEEVQELLRHLRTKGYLDESYYPIHRKGHEELRKAGLLRPDINIDAVLYLNEASALMSEDNAREDQEKILKAVTALKKAIELDPCYGLAYLTLGEAYSYMSLIDDEAKSQWQPKAEESWEKAIKCKPELEDQVKANMEYFTERSRIKEEMEGRNKKRQEAKKAREEKEALAISYYQNGIQAQEHTEKIQYLQSALSLKPDYKEACYSLGLALFQADKYYESKLTWEYYLKIDPDSIDGRIHLIESLIALGEIKEAVIECEKVIELDPKNKKSKEILKELGSNPK